MSTRVQYDHQLSDLSELVVTMASMVDKAIVRSMEALRVRNVALARDVRKSDAGINKLQRQGEERVVTLIALQGPMASDLRRVASTLSILSNLERMGDYAAGIAKIVIDMADEPLIKPLVDLPRMAQIAREMLDDSMTAFITNDASRARSCSVRDDAVDDLYDQMFQELLTIMSEDQSTINGATKLIWVAHNLERIADRVTNICERVVYNVTGEFEELDGGRRRRQRFDRNGSSDNGSRGLA